MWQGAGDLWFQRRLHFFQHSLSTGQPALVPLSDLDLDLPTPPPFINQPHAHKHATRTWRH